MSRSGSQCYLFAYGTLRVHNDLPIVRVVHKYARFESAAQARGRLFDLGQYPGMRLSYAPGDWVQGEVFRVIAPSRLFPLLDAYEECSSRDPSPQEYRRVQRLVRLDDGSLLWAWMYVYNLPVSGWRRIPSGDYLRRDSLSVGLGQKQGAPLFNRD